MKHVSILPLQGSTMASIDSCHQLFSRLNDILAYQGRPRFYKPELVADRRDTLLSDGLYTVRADKTTGEVKRTDVIVLPLLCGDFAQAINENHSYNAWLTGQFARGAEIICLCTGSFYLASTGLLDGRACAVHWAARDEFTGMFPAVHVAGQAVMTDNGGIYTCGGGFSYLNLLLYVFEKHVGRDVSILVSKMFEIDIGRRSQSAFAIFTGQKNHGDPLILKIQEFIETHPGEPLSVEEICRKFHTGRRTFERKFRKCTGNSVAQYIQRVKVEYVKKALESGNKTVSELGYDVGYNDLNAFRKIFRKHTDLTPSAYRKRYASLLTNYSK